MPIAQSNPPFICKFLFMVAISGGTGLSLTADEAVAGSQTPKTLVELFTSQGCNSCPPANALLKKYSDREDVIALSLPIDYWDYLGWKDTFGKKQFSDRQRGYATSRGDGQIYTPQIVVNGVNHAVGSHPNAVDSAIAKSRATLSARRIPLEISLEGNQLTIRSTVKNNDQIAAIKKSQTKPTIWLAFTSKKVEVAVPRGENRGKIITYYNVVRDLKKMGAWNGETITITMPDDHSMNNATDGCVVFLQEGPAGPIIAAAEL